MPKIDVVVYDQFNRPEFVGEKNSGQQITETAGYIPANVQIEDMMMAGIRLDMARLNRFDGTLDDEMDDFVDPTRTPGFDLADAHVMATRANDNLKKQHEKLLREKKEKEEKEKAENDRLIELGKKYKEPE